MEYFNPIPHRPRNRGWGGPYQMWYEDENGIWQSIERPIDWADRDYFLGIDRVLGIPAWLSLTGEVSSIVRASFIPSGLLLFPPDVSRQIQLPLIGPTSVLYPPALPIQILVGGLGPTSTLNPPTIVPTQLIAGGFIGPTSVVNPPVIETAQSITAGTIGPTGTLYPPLVAFQPWDEIARQESLSSGRLELSGLSLSNYRAVRLFIDGVRVTNDDSQIHLRLIIAGSELSSGYDWTANYAIPSGANFDGATGDSKITLTSDTATIMVGNAATESFNGEVITFEPGGSSLKGVSFICSYLNPSGDIISIPVGVGKSGSTGAVTGFIVYGSSDLVAGSLVLQGVE